MQSESKDYIKIKAYYDFCLFPKTPAVLGVDDDTYGVVLFEVVDVLQGRPIINKTKQTITITGEFLEPLEKGVMYTILAKPTEHPKYGTQYNLVYLNKQIDLHKLVNQKKFLSAILTPRQIEELYKTYDDPMSYIERHDIEGLTAVNGIGLKHAQSIIDKFEDNKDLSTAYIELEGYGFTPRFLTKLMNVYKSATAMINAVKLNPYRLAYEVDGVGFKKADDIALKGGINPKHIERVKAFIRYALDTQASEHGNSYIVASELEILFRDYFNGLDNILEQITDEETGELTTNITLALKQLQDKGIIVVEPNENAARRRIYLTYYYNLEKQIACELKRLLDAPNKFKYDDWQEKIAELEKSQNFPFAKEQLDGIKLGLDSQVCLISGLAGSGKSSLVSGILAALKRYSFAQCALSGKAAARLQEVTGAKGQTIHRLLGYGHKEPGSHSMFQYTEDNQLPYNIIILDEVSLVGGEIFLDLIKAIPSGSKLIMLGDLGQLEAIGALNLAADFHKSPVIPTVELTEVHRQAAQSGIIMSSHEVRNRRQLFPSNFDGVETLGNLQDITFDLSVTKDNTRLRALDWFTKWYDSDIVNGNIMNIQVIAPIKERGDCCVYNLNNDIQNIVNPVKPTSDCMLCGSKDKPYRIHLYDKVMCIKNNYKTTDMDGNICPIYNGWVGIVTDIIPVSNKKRGATKSVIVDFPLAGGKIVIDQKDAYADLVLGYASTIHKLQGSDAPVVIGTLDYSTPPPMLTCQLLYTMITRAKKRCVIVGQTGAISKAISNDYVSNKQTFLPELLEDPEIKYESIEDKASAAADKMRKLLEMIDAQKAEMDIDLGEEIPDVDEDFDPGY